MRKLIFITATLFIFIVFVAMKTRTENKMLSFRWMLGTWKMETKRGAIMETWIHINDSSMAGESFMVKMTGGTMPLEKIQLLYRKGEYFYIPVAKGQNNEQPVSFRITSYTEAGFVAENTEHDFPKRITYILVNKDSVHAFVDGGPSMPDKRSDFYYSKMK